MQTSLSWPTVCLCIIHSISLLNEQKTYKSVISFLVTIWIFDIIFKSMDRFFPNRFNKQSVWIYFVHFPFQGNSLLLPPILSMHVSHSLLSSSNHNIQFPSEFVIFMFLYLAVLSIFFPLLNCLLSTRGMTICTSKRVNNWNAKTSFFSLRVAKSSEFQLQTIIFGMY